MNDSDYTPEQLQHLAETMPDKVRIDDAGKIHSAGLTHRGARDGRTLRVELRAAARRSGRYGPGFGCPLSFDVQEVKAGRRESAGVQWVVRPRGGETLAAFPFRACRKIRRQCLPARVQCAKPCAKGRAPTHTLPQLAERWPSLRTSARS